MTKWSKPKNEHIVYEALSAIADGRFELIDKAHAKCTSTSGNKYYEILFDAEKCAIMSNDNMAYYVGEVSYPMVAMMLVLGRIKYDKSLLKPLKGIKWKDINQKNNNDYMKSVAEVLNKLENEGHDVKNIKLSITELFQEVLKLDLIHLGEKTVPPDKY